MSSKSERKAFYADRSLFPLPSRRPQRCGAGIERERGRQSNSTMSSEGWDDVDGRRVRDCSPLSSVVLGRLTTEAGPGQTERTFTDSTELHDLPLVPTVVVGRLDPNLCVIPFPNDLNVIRAGLQTRGCKSAMSMNLTIILTAASVSHVSNVSTDRRRRGGE